MTENLGVATASETPALRVKPRLLDLFCGAGGAAMGYSRAGFEVVGVDIKPQPRYPFEFVQDDALELLRDQLDDVRISSAFDAIHASPPCQAYMTMSNRWGSDYPELIDEVRDLLMATGLPWVIENVAGARPSMRSPYRLTGEMFGLGVHRPRLFETNFAFLVPEPPDRQPTPVAVYGKNDQRRLWTRTDGTELRAATLESASEAMGIDWMTWDEIREAIPPAYTEFIGEALMAHLNAKVAA
jgi:DNA (cytosine-5)-methyltransferase 1